MAPALTATEPAVTASEVAAASASISVAAPAEILQLVEQLCFGDAQFFCNCGIRARANFHIFLDRGDYLFFKFCQHAMPIVDKVSGVKSRVQGSKVQRFKTSQP